MRQPAIPISAWILVWGLCAAAPAPADELSSLKNIRLAMTLPELRASTSGFPGSGFRCERSKYLAICIEAKQSVAGVGADIVVEFVPIGPAYTPRTINVPAEYAWTPDELRTLDNHGLVALKHEKDAARREAIRQRGAEEAKVEAAYKAVRIRAEFDQKEFSQVLVASTAKWGAPAATRDKTYSNAMNAKFTGIISTWKGPTSEIEVQERCENLARACLTLTYLPLRAAFDDAALAAAKARSRDL